MPHFTRKPVAGLSMIELMCVIAIISILAALSLGPMFKAIVHAKHVLGPIGGNR